MLTESDAHVPGVVLKFLKFIRSKWWVALNFGSSICQPCLDLYIFVHKRATAVQNKLLWAVEVVRSQQHFLWDALECRGIHSEEFGASDCLGACANLALMYS